MRWTRALLPCLLLAAAACQTTSSTEQGVDIKATNEIVDGEVARRIAELRYLHDQELLDSMARLATIGDAAMPRIRDGARSEDWLTRSSLAWVMGATGDRRYIPDLQTMLSDPVAGVRFEAATSLVQLGDPNGFSVLVDGLADGDPRTRYKCFDTLRRATGRDFGYQHDGSLETRRAAVARWLDWLHGVKTDAL
jgi:HEAT repeat protein